MFTDVYKNEKKIGSTRSIKTILAKGQAALHTNDGLILLGGDTGMDPVLLTTNGPILLRGDGAYEA